MLRFDPPSAFSRSRRALNEHGRAIATLKVSPRTSDMRANLKIYRAAVAYSAENLQLCAATSAVALTLQP